MWLFERPIAHRGYHNETATENSMSAFRLAIEKGYNIETDVHLLKSGEVVIFHDNTLNRVCKKNVLCFILRFGENVLWQIAVYHHAFFFFFCKGL